MSVSYSEVSIKSPCEMSNKQEGVQIITDASGSVLWQRCGEDGGLGALSLSHLCVCV